MRWTLNQDAKPHMFEVVAVRYLGGLGGIVECEGFWTGYGWRVVGERYKVPYAITEWSYLPMEL